jgi:hypothetical protein
MDNLTTKLPLEIVRGDVIITTSPLGRRGGTWTATGSAVCCEDIAEIPVTDRANGTATTLAVDLHRPLSISRTPRQELIAALRKLADDLDQSATTEMQVF